MEVFVLREENKDTRKIIYEIPEFDGKNVPVNGILPIGTAFKKEITDSYFQKKESSQYDFYISPRLLWEYTGIIYKSNK